ncbi:MAG: NUDIX domain-containing protein [Silvanigrellaceae bacterium]|nr:NUDIX domain-containing protein [Silvanigrellaceae bacterium]
MNSTAFVPLSINNEEDLNLVLSKFPDIKSNEWIKSVSTLYGEIKNGECILGIEDEKLHRRVDVVSIKCFYTNEEGQRFQIFEEKQVFKNGMERRRGHMYVAEKLQPNETLEECAKRGLAEELQIAGPDVHVMPLAEENTFEKRESPTYKGIQCSYNTHFFSYEVPKLFYKESYVEEQDDKSTFFSWIKI